MIVLGLNFKCQEFFNSAILCQNEAGKRVWHVAFEQIFSVLACLSPSGGKRYVGLQNPLIPLAFVIDILRPLLKVMRQKQSQGWKVVTKKAHELQIMKKYTHGDP